MTPEQLIKFVEDELSKAESQIAVTESVKNWMDQGSAAKRALRSQQNALTGIWTILKGAMANAG